MSLHTNFHAPRATLSGRIQIGHKSGYYYYYYLFSVHIKPPKHRFGLSLCLGLAIWLGRGGYHSLKVKNKYCSDCPLTEKNYYKKMK